MGYDIPFREPKNFSKSAKSYQSDRIFKQTYDADEINSYITNPEHKVAETAEITLEFFLFPQTDVLKKGDFTKYYGWNMENAGIAFFRHNRGIQFGKWAPFANTDSYLTRCGMRISFTPCLDNYFGCDYRKTQVNPLEYLEKMLNGTVQTLFTQAKTEFKKHRTIRHGNGNTMLDKVLMKISKWFKKNNTVLPKLPPASQSSQENLGTGKKRGKYKKRKVTDKITFDYYESDTNELYRTVTSSKFANCCEIHWNHGHTFFQKFIEKVDESMLFPIVTTIVAQHWAREQNRPDEVKADRSYYEQLQRLDELQGEWMEKMWKAGVNY